ncbi:RICIN domain-containing protein [Actinocrinis puniceicyclus]|uniref:RICIN domain-containing protein n=1 Tax=Actinocrinis puniceicyclus TaxID=977794 RepID=A0A8J7WJI6_9ACTN|nr:RICIN domain-containing protein [Actinocrinis puniceicyclus]MBS2962060.1 RICIN domain-containing protein [Actinocrinis puniceicyclus]
MPASDSIPEHQHQLTRRRLVATGVGAAAAFGLPRFAPAASAASANAVARSYAATGAAVASVDLSGSWSFTPVGQGTTSIMVPGGGWYKQGFTNVGEAVYSRSITVPDSGQPQSVWIEFGVVNHQATLSVDGRVVGTQTTAFTPSTFDITAYVTPGSTHTISVDVKGRNALKSSSGNYLVPVAADWCEAVPQGIFRSAFLRVYPAVYVSDAFVRTSVANQSLTYDVSVTNTSGSSRSVTLTGSLASDNGASFSYPTLPSATVTVAAHSTAKVTVGPVAWNLGTTSYWWPNVPYRSGYRAQLHDLSVHASTDDGHTSDATYRFGFREFTQNGSYYYLNGIRANLRGDNLQGADYDRVNNGGVGDAYDTLPGFLPPSGTNGGWPQAVDNYQRLNYNVVRIHQEPASPYMLDVADEMGLMIIDETAIRGSNNTQDFVAGHDNMVNHARALVLRDRNHPAVIRWSQANEPTGSTFDSQQFEQDLYAAMNGNDGTRPISVDAGVGTSPNHYPNMTYANFNLVPHYLDGFGHYGDQVWSGTGRPTGDGEYIWPACNNKQGFEWFATSTAAKRGKDASDLRPYTLLSAWAGFVPGVKSTDFTPEEGGHPIYGADNLTDPWSNPQIQRIQAAFNPIAALDLPYWSASGVSNSNGDFPLAASVPSYAYGSTVTRNITVFNDDFAGTSVGFTWTAHLDQPTGTVIATGTSTLTIPLGSRVTQQVTFTAPASGSRIYLVLATSKSGTTTFSDAAEYFTLSGGSSGGPTPGTYHIVNRNSGKPLAIAGNSTADGAKAVQQTGGAAWTIATTSGGAYTLTYTATGKVLDVNGGSSAAGLQLEQWTANGGTNQQWYLKPTGDGYYTIVSHDSGLVADVYGRSTSDGAQVVQWTANGGTNQQWQLVPS